ncbi:Guanine nucleotide-binding protein-like 3 [Thoreauomyces humboldtii]|nr:Guanine nucleotide-binding protein-like 3 [Thoreauomyces humboldtii]
MPSKKGAKVKRGKEVKQFKKANEDNRAARKEARLNPQAASTKLKRDPGIPNITHLKDKLAQQAEATKRKAAEAKERQKEARLKLTSNRRGILSGEQMDLAQLAREAAKRSMIFDAAQPGQADSFSLGTVVDAAAAGQKDNSRKAYYKEFKKVVENADVILEVLDARDPLGCRTRQIEELVLNAGADKRIILILNKIDLVPREVVEQWLKYLRNEFPTIAFKASTQNQRQNLGQSTVSADMASDRLLASSECLGADNLMKLLKNYCRNANIKTSITVGVIGFPNVGKSSVINSLKRTKVCNVGSTPGVTKVAQTIQLDKGIKLLDCPGIVFSQSTREGDEAEVLLRNCVKVELLADPISPVEVIVGRCNPEQLMRLYNVGMFTDTRDFLIHVAQQRGKLRKVAFAKTYTKGGIPDLENAARAILQDWNSGRIPFYTVPPLVGLPTNAQISSAIVEGWSREFELPDIVETEGKELESTTAKSLDDMMIASSGNAAGVAMDMEDLPEGYGSDNGAMDEDEEEVQAEDDPVQESVAMEVTQSASAIAPTQSEIRFKEKTPKILTPAMRLEKAVAALSAAETQLNPQLNQERKKQMKLLRKKGKKGQKSALASSMEVEAAAEHIFASFENKFSLAALPGADSDEEL